MLPIGQSGRSKFDENGMTTISYVVATGFSLIFISWCAIFIVMSYSRAAIRNASDRALRAGVVEYVISSSADQAKQVCMQKFNDDINQALTPSVLNNISTQCNVSGTAMTVHTTGSLNSISSLIANFSIDETSKRDFEDIP